MDKIELTGMTFFGRHGCLPEEREKGQTFLVDAVLWLDLAPAGTADDLEKTVDYAAVFRTVQDVVEGPPALLIEAVAEKTARAVLEGYPLVRRVRITVHKPQAPIPGKFADVSVTVRRERS